MSLIQKFIKKNPLFFAFFFPAFIDGLLTLLGQDASYWTDRRVVEGSPAYYVLLISPWLFIIGSFLWFASCYWVFKRLEEPLNLFLMFLFIAGHSWGSSGWLWQIMKRNGVYRIDDQISVMLAWSINIVYFILISLFATYSLRAYLRKQSFHT